MRCNVEEEVSRPIFPAGMMDAYQSPNQISFYRLNFSETIEKSTILSKKQVTGPFLLQGNVAKVVVNEVDVSKDVNLFDDNCLLITPKSKYLLAGIGFTSVEDYHDLYTSLLQTGSELPRKSISVSMIGLDVGALSQYITPDQGLESYSVGNEYA